MLAVFFLYNFLVATESQLNFHQKNKRIGSDNGGGRVSTMSFSALFTMYTHCKTPLNENAIALARSLKTNDIVQKIK